MESSTTNEYKLQLKINAMKNIQLTLINDVLKKDHQTLQRDFKKGETVYLVYESETNCFEKNGLTCTLDGRLPFFQLPETEVCITYKHKEFGIFMIHKGISFTRIFAKEFRISQLELLNELPTTIHTMKASKNNERPGFKIENHLLKITILKNEILNEVGGKEDMNPLY